MSQNTANIDPVEVRKFDDLASRWWDTQGEFRPLHEINPLRLDYVDQHATLEGKKVLDVGCGGGILAESMFFRGAEVTGIDLAGGPLEVAHLHGLESGAKVEYRQVTVEELAAERPESYDVITCMEMLEHVPDPSSVVEACTRLAKPGGQVFFSTINRNPKSYLLAIVGAEYVLQMLPKGTHDYAKFIRPSELGTWVRHAGLDLNEIRGMSYNPLTRSYSLGRDIDVNYLVWCSKP